MSILERVEDKLREEINLQQVRDTSVDETDYLVSLAGFLYYDGEIDLAEELLEEVKDDPMGDYLKTGCVHRKEGWNDETRRLIENFREHENTVAGKILALNDSSVDDVTTVSLLRRAAFAGDPIAMRKMADVCHNGDVKKGGSIFYIPRGSMNWQDRSQEEWWRELYLRILKGASQPVMYHAFNQMEGSYDKSFSSGEINDTLLVAAALGSDQAVDYLIGYYTRNMEDTERLKKSLFWLYHKKEKYGLTRQEESLLARAEERIKA